MTHSLGLTCVDFEAPRSGPHLLITGELIGTVTDPLGEDVRNVYSPQNGIVLVLRTFPRVIEGQSLGVILETS